MQNEKGKVGTGNQSLKCRDCCRCPFGTACCIFLPLTAAHTNSNRISTLQHISTRFSTASTPTCKSLLSISCFPHTTHLELISRRNCKAQVEEQKYLKFISHGSARVLFSAAKLGGVASLYSMPLYATLLRLS